MISNVFENGKPIGQLGAGEASWHTDSAFVDEPPAASLLYAIEIPSKGGNTCLANMTLAWNNLDPALRVAIEGRLAKHDYTYTSVGDRRKDFPEVVILVKLQGQPTLLFERIRRPGTIVCILAAGLTVILWAFPLRRVRHY